MSSRDVQAGRAYVELGTRSKIKKGLSRALGRLKAFSKAAVKVGAVGVTAAATAAFVNSISAASRLEETMNKFNVVFADNAKEVKSWGDGFAGEVGRGKEQIASFLAESQDLFVPLGFDQKSATEMSKTVTRLSVDLASFNNKADADVLNDMKAALTGSGEVMKKYGVILSEAAVKQELLNMGMDPKTATNQAKVQARLAIIMRGTASAQGDATRSSEAFANQMKRLKGNADDAFAAMGKLLLPIVTKVVSKINEVVQKFVKFADNPKKAFLQIQLKYFEVLDAMFDRSKQFVRDTIGVFASLAKGAAGAFVGSVFAGARARVGIEASLGLISGKAAENQILGLNRNEEVMRGIAFAPIEKAAKEAESLVESIGEEMDNMIQGIEAEIQGIDNAAKRSAFGEAIIKRLQALNIWRGGAAAVSPVPSAAGLKQLFGAKGAFASNIGSLTATTGQSVRMEGHMKKTAENTSELVRRAATATPVYGP